MGRSLGLAEREENKTPAGKMTLTISFKKKHYQRIAWDGNEWSKLGPSATGVRSRKTRTM